MGAIELIVVLLVFIVVPVAIGGAALFGSRRPQRTSRSRVDWPKVFVVFMGIPLLLLVFPVLLWVASSTNVFHAARLESAQQQVAAGIAVTDAQTQAAHEFLELEAARHSEGIDLSEQHGEPEATPTGTIEYGETVYVQNPLDDWLPSHAHETSSESVVYHSPSSWRMGIASIVVLFVAFVFLGFLVWVSRKNGVLAFGIICAALLLGLGGVREYRSASHRSSDVVMIQEAVPAQPRVAVSNSPKQLQLGGLIPVGVDEAVEDSEVQPLRTREVVYYKHSKREINTSDRLPEWVAEANGESTLSRQKNEIILTSKRYTTVEEAASELRPLASSTLTDFIAKTYPEMRTSSVDPGLIEELGLLQKSCQVTWPLQVGEFTQEMQQLVWKLDISDAAKQKLHHHWQQQETSDRLAILGGGLGGLTLLFGAGALLTRRREEKKTA